MKLVDINELPVEGLIKQTLVTHKVVDGRVVVTTETRKFLCGDDYQDSSTVEVLYDANEKRLTPMSASETARAIQRRIKWDAERQKA
tara:strand:+ start:595 stop:855 length:261 start_codon:yes stop_codon:yes gene_type:complete